MRTSAVIDPTGIAATPSTTSTGIGHLAARLLNGLRRWWLMRQAMADIDELDDATLRDLGLTRWELREAARR